MPLPVSTGENDQLDDRCGGGVSKVIEGIISQLPGTGSHRAVSERRPSTTSDARWLVLIVRVLPSMTVEASPALIRSLT